jgi:phospholipid/cholesterol/gamma-HCH transport system substrate-binding protein
MVNQSINNSKLGLFVIAGLCLLIMAFYFVGKYHNLFGSNFRLRARFHNLSGLMEGNNVQFSGIQAGTVKAIKMLNDTTIEATLFINDNLRGYIHKNATVSIGTEGLMGNKVINITPGNHPSPLVAENDLLVPSPTVTTDEMLQTLSQTNANIKTISDALKRNVLKLDSSPVLQLFSNKHIAMQLRRSLNHIESTTANAKQLSKRLNDLAGNATHRKSVAGVLLADTAAAADLRLSIRHIKATGAQAEKLSNQLNSLITELQKELAAKHTTLSLLLKDTSVADRLNRTITNIENGTNGFNQNMEALKHNFLFRGYFKKQEKEKK